MATEKTERKPLKMIGLKQQISRFLLAFIAVILVMLGTLLAIMIGSWQKKQSEERMSNLKAYGETLDESIMQLNDVVGSIYSVSSAFQGIYSYRTVAEKCGYVYDLLSLFQVQVRSNHYLGGLFAHYDNGAQTIYYTNDKLSYNDKKILGDTGKSLMNSSRTTFVDDITFSYSEMVQEAETDLFYSILMKKNSAMISGSVSLSQGILEQENDSSSYGVIYKGKFYATAGQGAVLSDSECARLEPGKNRVGNTIVYVHHLDMEKLAVVEIIPRSIWMYISKVHLVLLALILLLTVQSVRLYRFVSGQLTRPLEDMTRALLDIRAGVWEVNFTAPNRITEIENVRQTVQVMLKEIEQYKIRTYEEQLIRQKTQLQFLQLQLAPHFYTNCLKNIYYMLMIKEYENAEQFLLRLSGHLRYLLQKDATLVTVGTETEFVENYIGLQEILSSRRMICEILVEEGLREEEIPILAIQTFVENSVKYAGQSEANLSIRIHVRRIKTEAGSSLDITVKDNGQGYPEELLVMLNRKDAPFSEKDFGVGITNLLSRLKIYYGDGAVWYFENRDGAFSEVIIPEKES